MKSGFDFWKGNKKYCSYIYYILLFFIVVCFFRGIFIKEGISFLWKPDGIYQHFNAFLYTRQYIYSVADWIFKGKEISVSLMNYTLGQGADIIITLNAYDFFDPVSWFSILLFGNKPIFAYETMIFLKLFLAGLSFCIYCHAMGRREGWKVASGALIYVFFGFGIYCCARHPNFMSGMYFLPLTYAAAEACIRKDRKLPLILVTFLSILTSYYSFYMDTICFGVYLLVRLFPAHKEEWKKSVFLLLKLIGISAVGVLLSSVTLLPTVYGFLNNARIGAISGYTDSFLYYPAEYYRKLAEYFINSYSDAGYWNYLGFAPVALICIWILFLSGRKQWNRLCMLTAVFFGMLCIPFVGLVMNGFGYVSNRWNYGFALVVAVVYVEVSGQLIKLSNKRLLAIGAAATVLAILCFSDPDYSNIGYAPLILLAITIAAIVIINRPYFPIKFAPVVLTVLILISVMNNIVILYGKDYGNYVSEFQTGRKGYDFFESYSLSKVADSADDEEFYRTEMQERRANTEGYHNVHGTTFWYSIMSGDNSAYYASLQLNTMRQNCNVQGLDGRAALLSLASVKYYTIPSDEKACYVPYGFTKVDEGVYENKYYLGPAYVYDSYISRAEYEKLTPLERQQAMLQGAVLEENTELVEEILPEDRMKELEYSLECENVELTEGKIKVQEKGGTITLYFDSIADSELYLWIDGIELDENRFESELTVYSGRQEGDEKERYLSKKTRITTLKYNWPIQRDGITFYMGYSQDGYNYCTIEFDKEYTFDYSGIHLYQNPMEDYVQDITKLQNNAQRDIHIEDDYIYGTVSCSKSSLLQLSVPYSKGWTAYVDDEKVDILKSNLMYMAINLSEGTHEIKLRYCTPFLKTGVMISGITFLGMVLFGVWNCWKTKRRKMLQF